MDDYCKEAQVFLNKDEALKHNLLKNSAMYEIYKKTLTNAFRNVKTQLEVPEQVEFMNWNTSFDYCKFAENKINSLPSPVKTPTAKSP